MLLDPLNAERAMNSPKGLLILEMLDDLSKEYSTELSVRFHHWHDTLGRFISTDGKIIQEIGLKNQIVDADLAIGEKVGWRLLNGEIKAVERCSHR